MGHTVTVDQLVQGNLQGLQNVNVIADAVGFLYDLIIHRACKTTCFCQLLTKIQFALNIGYHGGIVSQNVLFG